MAGESDGPDGAAARLEAALERIAAAAARRTDAPLAQHDVACGAQLDAGTHAFGAPGGDPGMEKTGATLSGTRIDAGMAAPVGPEIAARLDGLIERLRGALAPRPG